MSVVGTIALATNYGGLDASNKYFEHSPVDGAYWALIDDGPLQILRSEDDGATWTNVGDSPVGGNDAVLFVDVDGYLHVLSGSGSASFMYYSRGVWDGTKVTWDRENYVNGSSAYGANKAGDLVAMRNPGGTGWTVFAAYGETSSFGYLGIRRIDIASNGTITLGPNNYVASGFSWESIRMTMEHAGDRKTVTAAPTVWVAARNGNNAAYRYRSTYTGGAWTSWGPGYTLAMQGAVLGIDARPGGGAGICYEHSTNDRLLYIYEYAADGSFDGLLPTRPPAWAGDQPARGMDLVYDDADNIYAFIVENTNRRPQMAVYTRATGTWTAWEFVTATRGDNKFSLFRGAQTGAIRLVTQVTDALPLEYAHVIAASLNAPPNAPTLTSPTVGQTVEASTTERFAWTFSDPDAGDSQSQYRIEIRPQSGGANVVDVTTETPNTFHDVTGGTLTAGDYEWRVTTWDAAGEIGPASGWSGFTVAVRPDPPTIVAPTSGSTISSESGTVEWSTVAQTAAEVARVADVAGTSDPTTVYALHEVASSSTRTRALTFPVNDRHEWIRVRVQRNGLWSTWAEVRVLVSYTPPPAPTVAATPVGGNGYVRVSWSNPSPGVGEPPVAYVRIYRTVAGGPEILIATGTPSSTYDDPTVGARVDVTYRVVAVADNGTTASSASTGPVRLPLSGVWLHAADDPSTLRQHRRNAEGGTATRTVVQATRRFAGRTYPVVEYGPGRGVDVSVLLYVVDETALEALHALAGRVVCYRDAAGRRTFATLGPIGDAATFYGWDVTLTVTAVDYDETVDEGVL